MSKSAIPYLGEHGEAWQIVTGCDPVSPGCFRCWARRQMTGRHRRFYPQGFAVTCYPDRLAAPLTWRRYPRRVFVAPMGDLFHKDVPDTFIDRVFAVMALTPQHTYLLLTKRVERMRDYLRPRLEQAVLGGGRVAGEDVFWPEGAAATRIIGEIALLDLKGIVRAGFPRLPQWPLSNVWLGVSAERQKEADLRVTLLLDTLAAHRWASIEPMLEPILLTRLQGNLGSSVDVVIDALAGRHAAAWGGRNTTILPDDPENARLEYVVIGGESGAGHRPCEPWWIANLVVQCRMARVAAYVKQASAFHPGQQGKIAPDVWAVKEDLP